MPRPAPDLDARREQVIQTTRRLAETQGWSAVTMRRLASELGVTQPVIYTAFDGRQALVDAVALQGFDDLALTLGAVDATPAARIDAYLRFAAAHPRTYEAMFSLPSGLSFAAGRETPGAMRRAFAGIRDGFPDADETFVEVAWSVMHGLATLAAGGRVRADHADDRVRLAESILARSPHCGPAST